MITNNAHAVLDSLQEYKRETRKRLEEMVAMFAYHVAQSAISNTPRGDQDSLDAGALALTKETEAYYKIYTKRTEKTGIPTAVGYHQGAWGYSSDSTFSVERRIKNPSDAADDVYSYADSRYQLGDTFYIGAASPNYLGGGPFTEEMEANERIIQPTVSDILNVYQMDLKRFFDNANV